jgi:hypothetical protein
MQVELKAGDAVRVTGGATLTDSETLLLWINNRPVGFITTAEAERLRGVVKDPSCIAGAPSQAEGQ